MPKRFLLKRMDARRGDVAGVVIEAETPEDALALAPAGCWKLHRRVDEDEQRASRTGCIVAPCFGVPSGRGGRNF